MSTTVETLNVEEQYQLEGLRSELKEGYLDPRYIVEKLNKIFTRDNVEFSYKRFDR